jgi:hypothetical protein
MRDPGHPVARTGRMQPIQVRRTQRFRRPPDVVRSHFLDIQHHLATGVHQGVHYTILREEPHRLRLTQEFRVLGLKKKDELVLYPTADGRVVQEFLAGDFAGGGIELRFHPEDEGTRLEATLTAPLRGVNVLLRPIIRRKVEQLTEQALEEDRRDLDERGYEPGIWARSALAAVRAA